jgi:hypothetical protein
MSKKIAGYLNTNESYFVLVGAAHLAGPNSIIKLLEKSGIYGERIYSDQFDLLTTSLIQKKKKLPKHNE